eukprot:765543-Rhodomonas_salina.2
MSVQCGLYHARRLIAEHHTHAQYRAPHTARVGRYRTWTLPTPRDRTRRTPWKGTGELPPRSLRLPWTATGDPPALCCSPWKATGELPRLSNGGDDPALHLVAPYPMSVPDSVPHNLCQYRTACPIPYVSTRQRAPYLPDSALHSL